MKNVIDKIVLSNGKDRCTVHLANGTTLHFNFFKLGMTYIEGLKWIEESVLNCVNHWVNHPENTDLEAQDEPTRIIKAA